ncbi:hypothetical protein [Desulfosporosinus sp. I2]|uniref:hypothetical protein n=1 Tax=Desulfosporosinus sp. I2 TaxID=1617025 RepID=UPI0005ED9F87|nr:hypothetical protein [Desulfosporosinus sp. I2]
MKKEYVATLLFKNHRAADRLNTIEELCDSDYQQESSESQNDSEENNVTCKSDTNSNESSLPQRLLSVIRRTIELLCLDSKEKSF